MFVYILRTARHSYGLLHGTADYYRYEFNIKNYNLYKFLYILEV